MEVVYGWVKNLVGFYIVITAVLHLLPKESYRKYVKFFTGLLLVIMVVTPVLSLVKDEENLYERIVQAGFFQELESLKLDTAYMEESKQELYREEYEKAISMDVKQIVKRQELTAMDIDVSLTRECQVETIYIEAGFSKENELYREKAAFKEAAEYPAVHELRKELQDFYQIDDSQIEIVMREQVE